MVKVAILSSLSKNTIFFILPFSFSSNYPPFQSFFSSSIYLLFILFFSLSHPNYSLFQPFFSSSLYLLFILFSLCLIQTIPSFKPFFLLQTIFYSFFFLDKKESKNQGLRGGG